MALVDYSDSDESETEHTKDLPPPKPASKPPASSNVNFSVDRSNPQKIRVKLSDTSARRETHEDEPAAKKARLGGGGFSGFNSLLPPPKRDADAKPPPSMAKGPVRKVFSLKTGAEPGFSRESDAELKQLFTDQDTGTGTAGAHFDDEVGIANVPKKMPTSTDTSSQQTIKGNAFMFKPLSVARNSNKKKKAVNGSIEAATLSLVPADSMAASTAAPAPADPPPPKQVSLFSMKEENEPEGFAIEPPEIDDIDPIPASDDDHSALDPPASNNPLLTEPQDLNSIASDLNLSAAQRRQLFGRNGKGTASAINVANFNTDQEYLANEEIRATGEQVQHNPLRAIAPGKHSLKQLVNAAQGQKDALEESFAQGRRNKKEAGNKYGW